MWPNMYKVENVGMSFLGYLSRFPLEKSTVNNFFHNHESCLVKCTTEIQQNRTGEGLNLFR